MCFINHYQQLYSLDKVLSYGELLSTKILAEYLCQIGIPAEQLDARKVILTDNYFGHAFAVIGIF